MARENEIVQTEVVNVKIVQNLIHEIRGEKVMLDRDLAKLYGVETKELNQAVKRNIERFPEDFMFQLTDIEANTLSWSQIVTIESQRTRISFWNL